MGRGIKKAAFALVLLLANLAGACAPVIKTSSYTLDLYLPDEIQAEESVFVDLYEVFVGDEAIVYRDQEIPSRLTLVRVVAIDGKAVPESASFGVLAPGRHLFHVLITETSHEIGGESLAFTDKPGERILQTSEIFSKRRFGLRLQPGAEVRFDLEGRPSIRAPGAGLFGPEGSCRREGEDNRICDRCQLDGAAALCIRDRHFNYF